MEKGGVADDKSTSKSENAMFPRSSVDMALRVSFSFPFIAVYTYCDIYVFVCPTRGS